MESQGFQGIDIDRVHMMTRAAKIVEGIKAQHGLDMGKRWVAAIHAVTQLCAELEARTPASSKPESVEHIDADAALAVRKLQAHGSM